MSNVNPVAPAPQPRAPKSPAIIWTAVLALIPLLIDWLQGEYFSGEDWVLLAVALLTMAARFIEVYVAQLKVQEASGPTMSLGAGTLQASSALTDEQVAELKARWYECAGTAGRPPVLTAPHLDLKRYLVEAIIG